MILIGLIRHAPTSWNAEGRLQGRSDVPLSEEGRASFRKLRPPTDLRAARWYVSPLVRARETAELLGIIGATPEPRLVEMSFGEWEGRTLAELRNASPTEAALRPERRHGLEPPGGERTEEVTARLADFLKSVAGGEGTIGAVTHLGVIRAALALAHGWDMGRPTPETVFWDHAHLFRLDAEGMLRPHRLNVPLERIGA